MKPINNDHNYNTNNIFFFFKFLGILDTEINNNNNNNNNKMNCHVLYSSKYGWGKIPDNECRLSSGDVPLTYSSICRTTPQYKTTLSHLKASHVTSVACDKHHTLNIM